MARNIEIKTIPHGDAGGSVTFKVTQEGFASGRAIFVRVAKALGPSFAMLAESAPSVRSLRLAPAVKAAVENLSDADLEFLAQKFGASTQYTIDGQKWPYLDAPNREELFGGSMLLFFQWIMFCLEVNFADFYGALSALRESGREGETPQGSTASPKS